jgi:hypothetical protein
MPLDQDIEGGHGEREPGVARRPDSMHDLFAMADERQHRQHRLHEQAVLPLAALTQFEVAGIPLGRMKGGITQDNHPSVKWSHQPLKGVIRDIGGGTLPPHDHPPLIEQQTDFPFAESTPHILNFKLPVEMSTQPQPLQDCFLHP